MANSIAAIFKKLDMMTLEDLSLRKVAILLLSDPIEYMFLTVKQDEHGEKRVISVDKLSMGEMVYQWVEDSSCPKSEHIVPRSEIFKSIVAKVGLPEKMREPLIKIMDPIFLEACEWLIFHEKYLKLNGSKVRCQKYIKHIHFTCMGTVDYRKTAEAIVRDGTLSIDRRFKLACLNCLEEDIQDLWQKLSPESKACFSDRAVPTRYGQTEDIIVFWTYILTGRVDKLQGFLMRNRKRFSPIRGNHYSTIYEYAFETCAIKGYVTATQYFFEKLTWDEKDESLTDTFDAVIDNCRFSFDINHRVSLFLLSQMNEKRLQDSLRHSCYDIIEHFLVWPMQDAFPDFVKLLLPYLSRDYERLHRFLYHHFKARHSSQELLRDLFLILPEDFKHTALNIKGNARFIEFMFRNMDPAETLEFILSDVTLCYCYELVTEGKWDSLEFFIREAKPSKEGTEKFAVAFNSKFASLLNLEICERFTKMTNDISAGIPNPDLANSSEVNRVVYSGYPSRWIR